MENFTISKEKSDIELDILVQYLSIESYWAKGRSKDIIRKSIDNSICYSAILNGKIIGQITKQFIGIKKEILCIVQTVVVKLTKTRLFASNVVMLSRNPD